MKTNNIKVFLSLLAVVILMTQCKEEFIQPLESNSVAPGPISNVKVANQHAQASLTYTLPSDGELLYVKAVYLLKSGVQREVKSSYYNNSMIVDGFGDTLQHEVKLYAVNRSEVESTPVSVMVKPLRNSIYDVYETMQVIPDFGGVQVNAINSAKANVVISLITLGADGKWLPLSNIYTSQAQINQTFRGLDTIPLKIGITVRDRFLNYTDTLIKVVTPMFEVPLSKSLFKELNLPTDAVQDNTAIGLGLFRIWNNVIQNWQRLMTKPSSGPQWVSIDLGQSAHLSRIVLWNHVENSTAFISLGLRFFEVWGSENPNPDGSWDSWVKLGSFENIKPSGLPLGQQSSEDFTAAIAGFSYNFRIDVPKLKYLRIKCLSNWGGTTAMDIDEISVFGDPR